MTRSRRGRGGHGGGGGGGGGHGGGDSRWLVTYADLLTLLMVLFLVLWVISTIDLKKFEKFKSGLGDFGNPAAAAPASTEVGPPEGVSNSSPTTTTTVPNTAIGADGGDGSGATTTSFDVGTGSGQAPAPELNASQLSQLAQGLSQTLGGEGLGDVVNVHLEQRGLVISVKTDNVLFNSASADLRAEATKLVDAVAPSLSGIANDVVIEGYTDNRPLHRTGYDNWDLSVDRAVAVLKVMANGHGIDASRLSAVGYGEQHPVSTGTDDASLARNRRVEIVVIAGPADTTATTIPGDTVPTGTTVPSGSGAPTATTLPAAPVTTAAASTAAAGH